MGSTRMQKKKKIISLRRRKLHIRPTQFPNSKSVKSSPTIVDTCLYIHLLKLRLEAAQKDYLNLMKRFLVPKEVKVEKNNEGGFAVSVTCEKEGDTLVSLLEAFEEMGLHIVEARVSCNDLFAMEATAVPQNQYSPMDVQDVTQAIIKATEKHDQYGTRASI